MKPVHISDMTVSKGPDCMLFKLRANGIELADKIHLSDFKLKHKEAMDSVNERFRNSIRFIKLYGKLPKKPDPKKLNVWTQTDTGVAVRGSKMPVKEFIPFTFA